MALAITQKTKSLGRATRLFGAALASTLILTGCGGGGGSSGDSPTTNRIFLAGDSLLDTGTFGFRATVQNSAGPTKIFIDVISEARGMVTPCPAYTAASSSTLVPYTRNAACTNFAIGGGRVVSSLDTPRSIVKQLQDMKASFTRFETSDLFLVDGGGNDFADLAGSFGAFATAAGAARASPTAETVAAYQAATQAYATFLAPLLQPTAWAQGPAAQAAVVTSITTAMLTAADPSAQAVSYGLAYSVKLADVLMAAIDENLVAAGATRVLVANPPNIVLTPAFSAVRGLLGPVVSGWISAYNLQLESLASARSQVAVYNLFAKFSELLDPQVGATYGFNNVLDAACSSPIRENPAACSTAALDAANPAWPGYFFSDGFHGTPKANEVIAKDAVGVLDTLRW
jgi:outer membrane lipase/esterase